MSSYVDICSVLCCYFYSLSVDLSTESSVPAGEAQLWHLGRRPCRLHGWGLWGQVAQVTQGHPWHLWPTRALSAHA